MRALFRIFVACSLLVGSAEAQVKPDALRSLVESYADKRKFEGTVLVARGDDILLEASYGKADRAWDTPNDPTTRYRIGSLTKPLLATLVMNLVEDDILSLQGTLADYLPDHYVGTPIAGVTVEQLLSHTSGVKDVPNSLFDPWWRTTARLAYDADALATELITPELIDEPGAKWRYNNVGYILLGLIIEEVTGAPYGDSLRARIFAPANMVDSGVFSEDIVLEKLAHGYAPLPSGKLGQPLRTDASVFFSAAGVYATARDLYRFDRALYGEEIINAATRKTMHTQQTTFPYGLGWGIETLSPTNGDKIAFYSHTGSIPG
ncbi:MAG: serine hydrolase domain-containing protein, partial [Pseudomonadota bacterium]